MHLHVLVSNIKTLKGPFLGVKLFRFMGFFMKHDLVNELRAIFSSEEYSALGL